LKTAGKYFIGCMLWLQEDNGEQKVQGTMQRWYRQTAGAPTPTVIPILPKFNQFLSDSQSAYCTNFTEIH